MLVKYWIMPGPWDPSVNVGIQASSTQGKKSGL